MILAPDAAFERFRKSVPAYTKWTFAASVVFGLIAHLYMLTNKLPNHDDIFHLFQCDYGTQSGRWFLPTVLQWDGDFSMPWLIGVLGILCLAGTACITTSLFHIRRPLACIITAALLVSFPTVASTFTYMFTADAYFFGLFLAAFAAFAVARFAIIGLPVGAVALILSMGIYQSYFPVATVLLVGTLLFDCLEGQRSFLQILGRGIKMVVMLGLGIIVYMAAARWATANVGGLSDYMGISSMGSVSLDQLPSLIRKCYECYREYFIDNQFGWNFGFIRYLLLAAAASGLVILLLLIVRRTVGVLRGVLALVLVVCYPLAGALIHIMVGGAEIHFLMIYGCVYILILPIALASFAGDQFVETGSLRSGIQAILSGIIMIAMAFTAYSYTVADNKAYLSMEVSYEQISAYSNRLVSAIQSVDGYTTDMPVVLVGSSGSDAMLDLTPEQDEITLTGVLKAITYRTQYSYGNYLNRFLALPNAVYMDDMPDEIKTAIGDVKSWMPTYPQEGSIQIVNGYIVVRLN